jgi:hypothetical protein
MPHSPSEPRRRGFESRTPPDSFQLAIIDVSPVIGGGVVGDFNNDGRQDLYVVAGGATRDRLYMNNGNGTFTDRALQAGIGERHMGVGAAVGDYDNDGLLDIYVTSHGSAESQLLPAPGHHKLWRNNGDGTFTTYTEESGTRLDGNDMGQTVADFDADGRFDWYVTSVHSVHSGMSNVPGTGNMLYMGAGPHIYIEESIFAGRSNFLSQSELSVHVGLGQVKSMSEVRVFWNDGTVTVF